MKPPLGWLQVPRISMACEFRYRCLQQAEDYLYCNHDLLIKYYTHIAEKYCTPSLQAQHCKQYMKLWHTHRRAKKKRRTGINQEKKQAWVV